MTGFSAIAVVLSWSIWTLSGRRPWPMRAIMPCPAPVGFDALRAARPGRQIRVNGLPKGADWPLAILSVSTRLQ